MDDESKFAEQDKPGIRQREKEELAALKRAYAHTTDPAKRAELANRLAMIGHDPNKDSQLGNPVPERQSPPKATADAAPDTDFNKAAAEARGLKVGADKPMPIGVDSKKLPGDQEMYNHETGEWSADINPGEQHMHTFTGDEKPKSEVGQDHEPEKPVKDEAKDSSKAARKEKAEAAEGNPDAKADKKPAAKPVPETSDPAKRDADKQEDKPVKPEAKPADKPSGDKEVKHVIVNKDGKK